jgi:hypothetical protein
VKLDKAFEAVMAKFLTTSFAWVTIICPAPLFILELAFCDRALIYLLYYALAKFMPLLLLQGRRSKVFFACGDQKFFKFCPIGRLDN